MSPRASLRMVTPAVALVVLLGLISALAVNAQDAAPADVPYDGWSELHIAAQAHFPGDPEVVAHHFCKAVESGLTQCLIFASEEPDAKLVGIEVVVDAATYDGFDPAEQALWHSHREEIPRVNAELPDVPADQVADVVAMLEQTYGKVYILWDPTVAELPTGDPFVLDVHATSEALHAAAP